MTGCPEALCAHVVPGLRGALRALVALCVLSVLSLLGEIAPARAATDTALPPLAGIREEVVLPGTVVNGNRLALNRFTDPRPAPLLLAEVRRIWSQRPAPIHGESRNGWMTLTQLVGDAVETFEVRSVPAGNGVEGRRTRWRRAGPELAAADTDAWLEGVLPAGSRVLDRVANQDGSRQLTTLVAATSAASASALQSLSSALTRSGFKPERRLAPSLHGNGMARFFARGSEELAVTISEHAGQRAIVIHYGRAGR